MWEGFLKKIEKQMHEYDFKMQPPATKEDIETLIQLVKMKFSVDLPDEYLRLLKLHNGFNWNGVFIYGSKTLPIPETEDRILGLVEANEIWRSREYHNQFLFFGDGNISLFALDFTDNSYKELDRSSDSVIKFYSSIDNMFAAAFESSLL
jgi:hypothetical protein